jgi:hypothetical protein
MDSCNQCCGSELIFLDSDSDPQTFFVQFGFGFGYGFRFKGLVLKKLSISANIHYFLKIIKIGTFSWTPKTL